MFEIRVNSILGILLSKFVLKLSKKFIKGGSNFPGKVALKLDKNILGVIANNYDVILVTGTNGKTTTTSMIYNILKNSNKPVITNSTGANMLPGIISCFIDNFTFKNKKSYAVIEVDEANVKYVTKYISPKIITITNLFRDQLDRYGEVYTTLNKILEGLHNTPSSTLVLNGDESLLGTLPLNNNLVYYGFDCAVNDATEVDINSDAKFCKVCKTPYKYKHITYNHLGSFYCENCGYKQPTLNYKVDNIIELTPEISTVVINNETYIINQPGLYNVYNALCALAVTKELGMDTSIIYSSLKNQSSHFGRQEIIKIGEKEVKIILVKNPAGYNQSIDTLCLDKRNFSAAFLLNDNYADGRDVSWIWDVNFEKLSSLNINSIFISGIRLYDMSIRLKIANLDLDKFITCETFDILLDEIINTNTDYIYILATYTAMINFRKFLHGKGYIKNLW